MRDGAILERRRDCKRNTLLTFYSVMQSAEIGLVENQPNTSIKRKEKKNQEKEPKQKEVGEEMLRTDLREMEQRIRSQTEIESTVTTLLRQLEERDPRVTTLH